MRIVMFMCCLNQSQ